MPIRVDGETIVLPREGAGYETSIRTLFPSDLAKLVIDHPEIVRP